MADHTWIEDAPDDAPTNQATGADRLAGRYRVEALLGRGGMGSVVRAWDEWLEEHVAIKLLRTEGDERLRRALIREVKLARRVSHPGVVRVHDLGRHEGSLFLVMELVEGRSLAHDLADHGPMPRSRALDVARQVADALIAAHRAGVVHHDLKPDNVLLRADGRCALGDFGIARAVGEARHDIEGTPAFMAPEQRERGERIDPRSDLYAFGMLMVAMLSEEPPRSGEPPDVRRLPERIAEIVRACTQSVAGLRFRSFEELRPLLDLELPGDPERERRREPLVPSDALVLVVQADEDPVIGGLAVEVAEELRGVQGLAVRTSGEGDATLTLEPVGEGELRARLVSDGTALWTITEDRGQPYLVGAVAGGVAAALGRSLPRRTATTREQEGFELYLEARHAMRHHWSVDVSRAVSLLDAAVAKLPDDPRIRATRTLVRVRDAFFERGQETSRFDALRAEARDALRDAPDRVDAWEAAARAELYAGHTVEAARLLMEATARYPGSAPLHGLLGGLQGECGDLEGGLRRVVLARWLEPGSETDAVTHAYLLLLSGRHADARAILRTPIRGPTSRPLEEMRIAVWEDRLDTSISTHDVIPQLAEWIAGATHVLTTHSVPAGYQQAMRSYLQRPSSPRFHASLQQRVAELLVRGGEPSRALELILEASRGALTDLAWLDRCPVLDGLRQDPRFLDARERVATTAEAVLAVLG